MVLTYDIFEREVRRTGACFISAPFPFTNPRTVIRLIAALWHCAGGWPLEWAEVLRSRLMHLL